MVDRVAEGGDRLKHVFLLAIVVGVVVAGMLVIWRQASGFASLRDDIAPVSKEGGRDASDTRYQGEIEPGSSSLKRSEAASPEISGAVTQRHAIAFYHENSRGEVFGAKVVVFEEGNPSRVKDVLTAGGMCQVATEARHVGCVGLVLHPDFEVQAITIQAGVNEVLLHRRRVITCAIDGVDEGVLQKYELNVYMQYPAGIQRLLTAIAGTPAVSRHAPATRMQVDRLVFEVQPLVSGRTKIRLTARAKTGARSTRYRTAASIHNDVARNLVRLVFDPPLPEEWLDNVTLVVDSSGVDRLLHGDSYDIAIRGPLPTAQQVAAHYSSAPFREAHSSKLGTQNVFGLSGIPLGTYSITASIPGCGSHELGPVKLVGPQVDIKLLMARHEIRLPFGADASPPTVVIHSQSGLLTASASMTRGQHYHACELALVPGQRYVVQAKAGDLHTPRVLMTADAGGSVVRLDSPVECAAKSLEATAGAGLEYIPLTWVVIQDKYTGWTWATGARITSKVSINVPRGSHYLVWPVLGETVAKEVVLTYDSPDKSEIVK